MKNIILITSDINENYNFAANVIDAKNHIIEYFGHKHVECDYPTPSVCVKTEVSKSDIEHIYELINDNAIHLTILLTNEKCEKRIDGDFIDLRDE